MNEREAVGDAAHNLYLRSYPNLKKSLSFGPFFYLYPLGRHPLQPLIDDLFLSSHGHEKPTLLKRYIGLQDIDHHVKLPDELMNNRLIN
jgi:hypothetical protein